MNGADQTGRLAANVVAMQLSEQAIGQGESMNRTVMLQPENAAFAVEKLRFATPNQATLDILPVELTNNTDLFPTSDMLAR